MRRLFIAGPRGSRVYLAGNRPVLEVISHANLLPDLLPMNKSMELHGRRKNTLNFPQMRVIEQTACLIETHGPSQRAGDITAAVVMCWLGSSGRPGGTEAVSGGRAPVYGDTQRREV